MAEARVDRRVNRTRRVLRESLMALVVEKGYDSVTIEDITERAELGRTTFYLHYKDKEELLLESIDTIADELTEKIYREVTARDGDGMDVRSPNRFRPIVFVFQHAVENRMLYQIILRGEGSTIAASRIRKIIFDAALVFFNLQLDPGIKDALTKDQMDLIAAYFSSSLLGFLTWWLETESKYSPVEMGDYYRRFFFDGMRSFIQMPDSLVNGV
jgi:AcrR family transcriptional regulator